MTLTLRLSERAWEPPVRRRLDASRLRAQLDADRYVAAYGLAQLEPFAWDQSEWWSCEGPGGEGIVCHSTGGLGHATTITGDAPATEAILRLHPGAAATFAICSPWHLDALGGAHHVDLARHMRRMLVTRGDFQPAFGPTLALDGRHTRALNELYSSEGGRTRYLREQIEEGCYRGVAVDDCLVAAAGTHAIARSHGIAILGNVFTHPNFRGRGCGRLATSAVTAELLREVPEVVLSVDPANAPAVRAYRRLGYRDVGPIIETAARRRAVSPGDLMRRWLARRRHERLADEMHGSR